MGTVAAVLLLWGVAGLPGVAAGDVVPVRLVQGQTAEELDAEAQRLYDRGIQHYQQGQFREAIEAFERVLTIFQEIGDRESEGTILNNLGRVYRHLGQYPQALEYYQQALFIRREVGDRAGEGTTLNNLGLVYYSLGQYPQALEYYQQALAIGREVGDRVGEGATLNNLGLVYYNLGEYPQALEFYQQTLAIDREIGNRTGEGTTLIGLGAVYNNLGEYPQALEFHQQALFIHREVENRLMEGATLNNLGLVYNNLGEYPQALEFHQQALAIRREIGDRAGESATLHSLGVVYYNLGEYPQALEYYQQTLAIDREIGNRTGEGRNLIGLGAVYRNLGEYPQALEYYQQALAIVRELGNRPMEGTTLNNLGAVYRQLGKYGEALDYLQQALAIRQEVGNRAGEGVTLDNLGLTFFHMARPAKAEQHFFAAIEVWESLRGGLTDDNKISLFDTIAFTYSYLQITLIAQNKTETALEIAERGRARAFVELMALRLSGQSQEEFVPPPPPTLAQIRQVAQEQNATLVEYFLVELEEKYGMVENKLYIWVVSPTGEIAFRQIEIADILNNASLAELVDSSRIAMGVRGRGLGVQPRDAIEIVPNPGTLAERRTSRLQQLHQLLIEPIADLLPTNPEDRVIFLPQGELFLVPFPALPDADGTYLVEKHTILTAPSIQVLELTRQTGRGDGETGGRGEVLVVGNPTMPTVQLLSGETLSLSSLPGAEREAAAIADFLGTEALIGDAATESTVLERLPQANIVHLATHGLLDDFGYGIPGAIALAPYGNNDGLLTAGEILDLKLNADLVVLSACDTGRGEITGDGVVGLSRALVTAGVPSIIVSLWKVDDAATAELMQQFYRNWQESGDKAQALRQAMLTTMQQHPE
ncbi:MAG TPA: tetratricopeptide repeat protein, partial [Oscillatoriales cyanobacterium M59_W2019_021]|nr:tetratricopeptide repeat protein [Oscillatoriales cyanobacterium M59_W2019_021]